MTNGVHTAMEEVKRTAPQPYFDPPAGDIEPGELPAGYHPVLPPGDLRNRGVHRRPQVETSAAFAVI